MYHGVIILFSYKFYNLKNDSPEEMHEINFLHIIKFNLNANCIL